MRKFVFVLFVISVFFVQSGSVLAQDEMDRNYKPYIGLGLGAGILDIDRPDADSTEKIKPAEKIFFGVDVNPNIALEFGFANSGNYKVYTKTASTTIEETFKANLFFASILAGQDSTKPFGFFGELGLMRWNASYNLNIKNLGVKSSESGKESGINALFGLGMRFKVGETVQVRVGWEHFENIGDGIIVDYPVANGIKVDGANVDVLGLTFVQYF